MEFYLKKVAVIGSGVMGSQIALQCAICGFDTIIVSRNSDGRKKARNNIVNYLKMMQVNKMIQESEIPFILNRLIITSEFEKAINDADYIIESVVEKQEVKKEVFKKISKYCRDESIVLTNTSSFVPSMFVDYIKNCERFCALHFYSPVWKTCVVDIMCHSKTTDHVKELVKEFAHRLKQQPIIIQKETSNYVFNSILCQIICVSIKLVMDEVTNKEDVDVLWKSILGTNVGPFGIMDAIGLDTVYNIIEQNIPKLKFDNKDAGRYLQLLQKYIDNGELGIKTGKGFFKY